jgi:hypothetical protein
MMGGGLILRRKWQKKRKGSYSSVDLVIEGKPRPEDVKSVLFIGDFGGQGRN